MCHVCHDRPRPISEQEELASVYLSPERELGAIAHRGRDIERADHERFHLRARQRVELHVSALQVGDEFRVPDHLLEGVAQRADALTLAVCHCMKMLLLVATRPT